MSVLNNDRIMNLTDNGFNINYQPYRYNDYNECNSAHDSDMYNHFTNTFPDSKYYPENVFSTSSITPGISFIHLNACSLNSNLREIDDYLSSLNYNTIQYNIPLFQPSIYAVYM